MVQSTVIFLLLITLTIISQISSENLNGIYVIDACDCTSPTEKCEPNGPLILDQQKSSFAVRYGATQVGVGTSGNNRLDLFLNKNRCKGLWNGKNHVADLKCQHQDGVVCATRLRCVSGSCLEDKASLVISSATMTTTTTISVISLIFSFLLAFY
ncbi:hypothetical protein I4U23_012389 [Adineta vaga]|nr:hypothetical protein I4U23_012389 [Adineta vaga]